MVELRLHDFGAERIATAAGSIALTATRDTTTAAISPSTKKRPPSVHLDIDDRRFVWRREG